MPRAAAPDPAVAACTADLLVRLRAVATTERAEGERRYLKSALTHLGVPLPEIRRATRDVLRDHPDLDAPRRIGWVRSLWAVGVYELRQAAVHVLERDRDDLDDEALDLVEGLVRDAHTWALVDPLAINVTGAVALRDPRVWARTDRWIADPERWLRRSALLAHLPAVRGAEGQAWDAGVARVTGYADRVLDEREFFLRKATGWVLREIARRDPAVVTAWLEPRIARASGVTVREAVKYLADDDRARLLALRGRRR